MKNLYTFLIGRLINGVRKGFSEYKKTFSKDNPGLTLYIFGWLGKIGKGLWNGVKGAVGGFFGGGGAITVAGAQPAAVAPIVVSTPSTEPTPTGKPNIILYVGIGVGVIIFIIVIMMVLKRR
jgi:preprotein translocase subunit Sec61beta